MPNYQIRTSGHLWERKLCGTTLTLEAAKLKAENFISTELYNNKKLKLKLMRDL